MLFPQRLLPPLQRSSVHVLSLLVLPLVLQHLRFVVHARQRVGMLLPQRLLPPFQRSSVHVLSLLVLPLVLQYQR